MRNEIGPCEGNCPVQSEGFIDGNPYYFRARGSHWTMDISAPGEDPVGGGSLYAKGGYVGPWPAAGWLPVPAAEKIIADCVSEFRAGKRGLFQCQCDDCNRHRGMTPEERTAEIMKELEERDAQGRKIIDDMHKDQIKEN